MLYIFMSIFKILCISSHVIFQPNFLSSYLINISNFLLICSVFTVFKSSEVTQSCLTLCDPMDHSPPGSSVHGIFQARILEWVAMPSSTGSSQESNLCLLCLLHWQADSLPLHHLGSPASFSGNSSRLSLCIISSPSIFMAE